MSLAAIDSGLQGDGTRVWLVLGESGLLVDRAITRIQEAVGPRCGLAAFNVGRWRCGEPDAAEAFVTARTVPMMADRRLVVLRDVDVASEAVFEALLGYLGSPSPSTVLVVCGAKLPAAQKGGGAWATKIPKAVEKVGRVVRFAAGAVAPIPFVQQVASEKGKRLGRREAELLVEIGGGDLGQLTQEVEKLCLFVGDRTEIDSEDVTACGSAVGETEVWALTAAVARRDVAQALAALQRLLESEDEPHRLIGLLTWKLREVLQVHDALAAGRSKSEVRQVVRMRPDELDVLLRAAEKHPLRPEIVLERVAGAYGAMNFHRAGSRRVLEALVLDLCSNG